MVSTCRTGAGTLSKAKINGYSILRRLPYTAERVIVLSQANISLANIYIGLKWLICRQHLYVRHIARECQKPPEFENEQFLQSSCCCLFKISMPISLQQGSAFITISDFVRNAKDASSYRIHVQCAWRQLRKTMSYCGKLASILRRRFK